MESKSIDWNTLSLSYRITGHGYPVVFLHGFAEDSSIWDSIIPYLNNSYKYILPDFPGTGSSSSLKGEASIEDLAESVKAILDAEKISKAIIIGHSMGGYVTLALVKKYPHVISHFGLFHSSAYPDNEEKKENRKKSIKFILENGPQEFLKATIPGLFHDAEKSSDDILSLVKNSGQFSAEILIQYYNAMISREDRTDVLRNFEGQILFLLGQHDKAVPFKDGLEQSYLPKQSTVHILRTSAHMGMKEEAGKTIECLNSFIGELKVN